MVILDKREFLVLVLALVVLPLVVLVGCRLQAGDDPAQDDFHQGRTLVTGGKYALAIPLLTKFLAEHPQHQNASRAGLFLGKAHLGLGDYPAARIAFNDTVKNYPATLEGHKSRYKLALLSLLEGDRDQALAQFKTLAENPDGSLAPEAAAMVRYLQAP
ncbi:tetratricopeptide repeat protein [Lignipirellula cremea]|uniref:Outer membrane protein assembly factor BamD n=1 Tax=Lignipirellula cremea TaxID=2528010 RepID=A0A518DVI1_9BACT|nr:tetratricopeptide repeat protein [Lignipirellula cremea]QDU95841.1 Outer membrane protein assembly factor BamD [Lignipirellula cremea]